VKSPFAIFFATCISTLALLAQAAESPFAFRDVSGELGIATATRGMMAHSGAWGDINNDGRLDLWIGSFTDRKPEVYRAGGADGPVPNVLLLQTASGFEPVKNEAIAWMGRATGCVIVDLDNDGWKDMYISNNGKKGKENLLYHNNRGKLELVTDKAGDKLELPEFARGVSAFDFNGDGLLDILVLATVNKGESMLFQNKGNMQFKRSKALPSDLQGLGLAVGDLTGNGWPDVFVGGQNRLFVNLGRGKYREATELGLKLDYQAEDDSDSCGVAMGDFDRDGRLDLLIGTHSKRPWAEPLPLKLYRNLGSTPQEVKFADVTEQLGLRPLPMKAPHVEMRDFDNDGWLDLYTAVTVFKEGKIYPVIYKNLGAKPGELPRFEETAFIHRPEYPEEKDYNPQMNTGDFYDALVDRGRVMYFAPGPASDYDSDGRLDLLLPSWFSTRPTLLLKNETIGGNYLDVAIVGSGKINRDGIGTLVQAFPPGEALVSHGNSFVASEQIATGYGYASGQAPVAHLGLGELKTCDLVITLPHNLGQIVKRNVAANAAITVDASPDAVEQSNAQLAWPPQLAGAEQGTLTLQSKRLLKIPAAVAVLCGEEGIAPFEVARSAPTVELAFHDSLGTAPVNRRLWSSWGDICLASDGSVYVGIGDHGHDAEGDGRCFIYRWNPQEKTLLQIVDMNAVVPPQAGQPAWTKVHAKIDEGSDGKIYFCCTLNNGTAAGEEKYHWTEQLPGAQIYQYDPATGKTVAYANLPPRRCTATSLYDAQRNIWWCNLEAGQGNALYGVDLKTKQVVYRGEDGQVAFNRNFALAVDGSIYFNGENGAVMKLEPKTKKVTSTGLSLPDSPGLRASTRESASGDIFGCSYRTNQLFRLNPARGELEMLGPSWGKGEYTTVMELSPDERYVYYLPGSHGQAFRYGTPVVQYNIATKTRKVLAFLAPTLAEEADYVPGGTYGMKLSADGSTLYVNFNGHASDAIRPSSMKPIGFGLTSFMAIHIPESER
jgi:hypothetical protein